MGRVVPLFHLCASIGMLLGDLFLYIILMCNLLLLFSISVASYCTGAATCMKASSNEAKSKFHLLMSPAILLTANGAASNLCLWLCRVFDLLLLMTGFSLNSLDLARKSWDDIKDKIFHRKMAFVIYFPTLLRSSCSIAISLNFLSLKADGVSVLPDSTVLYYEMQRTSFLHKARGGVKWPTFRQGYTKAW